MRLKQFKKLVIENFQSHEYTEIDFSKGLNVFVGPSDSGKSAILRALRWVLFNQPRGTDYIRTGASQCKVSLMFDDGSEVIRVRNKSGSINRYLLKLPDKAEPLVFEGFGNQVPPEIAQTHQMLPVKLDTKELYVQFGNQLESPFLLFESNQNKAKTIGRISGAHYIDQALKQTNIDQKMVQSEIKRLEQEREKLEQQLQPYENLPELERLVMLAEQAYERAEAKRQLITRLQSMLSQWQEIQMQKQYTLAKIEALKDVPKAEELMRQSEQKFIAYRQYMSLFQRWQDTKKQKKSNVDVIRRSEQLPKAVNILELIDRKKEYLINCRKLYTKWIETKEEKRKLHAQIEKLKGVSHAIEDLKKTEEKINQVQRLTQLAKNWHRISQDKHVLEKMKDRLVQVKAYTDERFEEIELRMERLSRLQKLQKELTTIREQMKKDSSICHVKDAEIAHYTKEWTRLLKEHGKCPTCNSVIDQKVLEKIMEEYQGGVSHAAVGRENQSD